MDGDEGFLLAVVQAGDAAGGKMWQGTRVAGTKSSVQQTNPV